MRWQRSGPASAPGAAGDSCQTDPVPDQSLGDLAVFYGVRTAWALVVAAVTIVVARTVRGVTMRALQRGRAHGNVIILLGNVAQLVALFIGFLVVLAIYTGNNFGWILTSFSVVGLVIGLSLQDILKNFFAGIYVLVERPFRIGDTIEAGGHSGVVEQISFRTTLLRTREGTQVVIPNSTLMTEPIVNRTAYPLSRAALWLVVDTHEAGDEAPSLVREALGEVRTVAQEPSPGVDLRAVTDGRSRFLVSFWTSDQEGAVPHAIAALRVRFPTAEVQSA